MTRSALIALAVLGIAAVALAAYAYTARPLYSPSPWSAPTSRPCSCPGGAIPTTATQPPVSPMSLHAPPHHGMQHFYSHRRHPDIYMIEVKATVESFQPPSMLVVRTANDTTIIIRVPPTMVDEDAHMMYMPLLLSRLATKGATVDLLLIHPKPENPVYIAAKITIGGHTYYAPRYLAYKLARSNTP